MAVCCVISVICKQLHPGWGADRAQLSDAVSRACQPALSQILVPPGRSTVSAHHPPPGAGCMPPTRCHLGLAHACWAQDQLQVCWHCGLSVVHPVDRSGTASACRFPLRYCWCTVWPVAGGCSGILMLMHGVGAWCGVGPKCTGLNPEGEPICKPVLPSRTRAGLGTSRQAGLCI